MEEGGQDGQKKDHIIFERSLICDLCCSNAMASVPQSNINYKPEYKKQIKVCKMFAKCSQKPDCVLHGLGSEF